MIPVIDMHCDTVYRILEHGLNGGSNGGSGSIKAENSGDTAKADIGQKNGTFGYGLRSNNGHIDLERMKKAGYMCQCFALYTPLHTALKLGLTPFQYAMKLNEIWDREIEKNPDLIKPVLTGSEIENNFKTGLMSALKTVEEGAVFEGSIDRMKQFYGMGVRMSTLTWNFENELAYPNMLVWETKDGKRHDSITDRLPDPETVINLHLEPDLCNGLKEKGREMAAAMEDIGMIIDVSHLSDAGIKEILDIVKKDTPVIASHSNARVITGHPRNLTDEMIRRIADHGGVAGLNFASDFLNDRHDGMSLMQDLVNHAKYMKNVGGIEAIGLGSDFDGIDNELEFEGCHGMPNVAEAFEKAGFKAEEIEKIFYKNSLRVLKTVLG